MFRIDRFALVWALTLSALFPLGIEGQLRTVVSSEIAVSEREASLSLEFQDDTGLAIVFSQGQILVNGETLGTYTRRDALDLAWRSLLGEVVTLDGDRLAEALHDWSPPDGLTGEVAQLAAALDRTLEEALAASLVSPDPAPTPGVTASLPGEEGLLEALLRRTSALGGLAEALEGVALRGATIRVGEDMVVEAGEELEGNLILVDGDLEVRGTIRGDVVVAEGMVRLPEGGRITGDLRLANGEVERSGGLVDGAVLLLGTDAEPRLDRREMEDLRRSLEREIRRDVLADLERDRRRSPNVLVSTFRNVGKAIGGLLKNAVTLLVLAALGGLALHFARERMDVVAATVRRAPVRSAVVGLAGGFLLIPAYVIGIVVLAVSIIGIPFIIVWAPLFPLVVSLAGLLGYLAVAKNVGEWVAEQEYRGLEWIRGSNAFYTMSAGILTLMIPSIASNALRVLGLGFFTGLLAFVGSMVVFLAVVIGLGAVLLTRGGKIRPYEAYLDFDEDFWMGTRSARQKEGPRASGYEGPAWDPGTAEPKGEGAPAESPAATPDSEASTSDEAPQQDGEGKDV